MPVDENAISQFSIRGNSATTWFSINFQKKLLTGWKTGFTVQQAHNILNLLKSFKMDFYNHGLVPDYEKTEAFRQQLSDG